MHTALVVTFTGPDRPGIVRAVSEVVRAHGANWEESRMSILAGRFAGILLVTVPSERADALMAALAAVEGLAVLVEQGTPEATAERRTLHLDLTGADREGIVHEVAQVLVNAGLNVEDLATETYEAPMAGGTVFSAAITVTGPPELGIEQLQRLLERLGDDLMVEIELDTD